MCLFKLMILHRLIIIEANSYCPVLDLCLGPLLKLTATINTNYVLLNVEAELARNPWQRYYYLLSYTGRYGRAMWVRASSCNKMGWRIDDDEPRFKIQVFISELVMKKLSLSHNQWLFLLFFSILFRVFSFISVNLSICLCLCVCLSVHFWDTD